MDDFRYTGLREGSFLDGRLTLLAGGLVALILATRILSGIFGTSKKTSKGETVPLVPYWVPLVGHLPQFFLLRRTFFPWARKRYNRGVFRLNLLGTTHNIIYKPAFSHILMSSKGDVADAESAVKHIMTAVFAWPKTDDAVYEKALAELYDCYKYLSSSPGLPKLIEGTIVHLRKNINSLVTFTKSPVDQSYWERTSNPEATNLSDGEEAVELNLFTLVRDFVAQTANPALFGTDFCENNAGVWENLWKMDREWMYLATGLPPWVPIPRLSRGWLARRRVLAAMEPYEIALEKLANGEDPGSDWSNLDNLSDLMKAREAIFHKYNFSLEARGSANFALLWAMNANANPATFWMIARVYGDPELLERIREEVRPYVKVRIPKQEFAVPELPVLEDVDHQALAEKCPLLKAAYIETLRVDTGGWTFKVMKQDLTLAGREKDADKFVIEKGTFCHVAHELHNRDPLYYENPDVWRPERHVRWEPAKEGQPAVGKADMGTIRPYGGGEHMCKGRQFALKEMLLFSATIFTFWDMEPPKGGEWKIPEPVPTVGTNVIYGEMRVRVKRRKIPA